MSNLGAFTGMHPADWERMPWHARQQWQRRARAATRTAAQELEIRRRFERITLVMGARAGAEYLLEQLPRDEDNVIERRRRDAIRDHLAAASVADAAHLRAVLVDDDPQIVAQRRADLLAANIYAGHVDPAEVTADVEELVLATGGVMAASRFAAVDDGAIRQILGGRRHRVQRATADRVRSALVRLRGEQVAS